MSLKSSFTSNKQSDIDLWALNFFDTMMEKRLSVDAFEDAIFSFLSTKQFVFKAPETAQKILALIDALGAEHEAGYGSSGTPTGAAPFRSHWLVGQIGIPGAVHIGAPPEQSHRPKLAELNRPMHRHDSGRIGLITTGKAVFHFMAVNSRSQIVVVDCPVGPGDLIFWPAWTPHTFDACNGFSLLSAMASYVSPREDGFVYPLDAATLTPDSMLRVPIDQYLCEEMNLSR
jgi:hypothetical protein